MLAYVLCAVVVVSASASEEKDKEKETCTAEAPAVWAALDDKQKKKKARALYFAAKKGEKDTVMQLLDQAVEPDYYKTKHGHTALLAIAQRPMAAATQIGEALIKHGADVNAKDVYGKTALQWCACVGGANAVELAKLMLANEKLERGGRNKDGKTAMDEALERSHADIVEVLR